MLRTYTILGMLALGCAALGACAGPQVATCYGIAPGSRDMDQCIVLNQASGLDVKADRQAAATQIATEVRDACLSYGLAPGSENYRNCLVREADTRLSTSYAGHFSQPGARYDQKGNRVDSQGFLTDRSGQRIGGRGYWITGPGDAIVPPGTVVGAASQPGATSQPIPSSQPIITSQRIITAPPIEPRPLRVTPFY